MEEVKLIGFWPSPFVHRVQWALTLKGVKYEYIEDDIFNKSEVLLKLNPIHKRVPILVHGEKSIVESMVILEYIEETWPQNYPLLPSDPYERSEARFWIKFGEDKIRNFIVFFLTTGEKQENAVKEGREVLKILEEHGLKEKSFFNGNEIGMTDLEFGWIACWLEFWEAAAGVTLLDPETFPKLHEWSKNFKDVPVIKESLNDREKMSAFMKFRREMFISTGK